MDEIFEIWPSLAEMARDMGEKYPTVAAWKRRGIPARRDADVIAAARQRGFDLTYEQIGLAREAFLAPTPAGDAA
ncbi:hypothetical protein [Rhodovulum sulfidophilum]|uniref:hypothetical protein n=1 Tax=Rhodovulum sulfidophilum TaxID=35806 RepID=UPI0019139867|nr:hypothetical protein [Rhodovulum sulfidophilum]